MRQEFADSEFGGSTVSINRFYERRQKLMLDKEQAEARGKKFIGAAELAKFERFQKRISEIKKQIRTVQESRELTRTI